MMKEQFWFRGPVKKAAAVAGLRTQKQVAAFVGVTQPTIGRFFRRGSCSEPTARKIAEAFGLDVEKLRDDTRLKRQARLFAASELAEVQGGKRGVRIR